MDIYIPVSPAELMDKLTILEIKLREITDADKLKNIHQEHSLLAEICTKELPVSSELSVLKEKLLFANQKIWESENDVREFWNDNERFIAGAKQSHFYNDERAEVKREINTLLGTNIIEEKSHPKYEHNV